MKYSQSIGIGAALLLIAACFLPWAYYPDIQKDFTGFFSEQNAYGRPGKLLVALCLLAIVFFLIPKVWAKRANIFLGAVILAFSIKSYILFTACYRGTCPDKQPGIFLVVIAPLIMIAAAILPNMKLKSRD
jgi:amino acid permease